MQNNTSITNTKLEKDPNKQICEALGCFEQATIEIKINAGKFGKIPLFLCKKCIPKFTIKGGQ